MKTYAISTISTPNPNLGPCAVYTDERRIISVNKLNGFDKHKYKKLVAYDPCIPQ
jgi:hypothetical protein